MISEAQLRLWLARHRPELRRIIAAELEPIIRRLGVDAKEFVESDHPRDADGKFSSGGGGGGGSGKKKDKDAEEKKQNEERRELFLGLYKKRERSIEENNRRILGRSGARVRSELNSHYHGAFDNKIGTTCTFYCGDNRYSFYNYGFDCYAFDSVEPIKPRHKDAMKRIREKFKGKRQ